MPALPKKGVSLGREENENGEVEAGLYQHPVTGHKVVTKFDPLYGNAQAEAFTQVGYEYVGPAPEGWEKTLPELAADERKKKVSTEELLLELYRRDAKRSEDFGQQLQTAVEEAHVPVEGAEATKAAGVEKVASEQDNAPTVEEVVAPEGDDEETPEAPVKPLKQQNREELEASGREAGLEDVSVEKYPTKADLLAAIKETTKQESENE